MTGCISTGSFLSMMLLASTLVLGDGGDSEDGEDANANPAPTGVRRQELQPSPPARAVAPVDTLPDVPFSFPLQYPRLLTMVYNRVPSYIVTSSWFKPLGAYIEAAGQPVDFEFETLSWAINQVQTSWSQTMTSSQVVALWLQSNMWQSYSAGVEAFVRNYSQLFVHGGVDSLLNINIRTLLQNVLLSNAQHHNTFEIPVAELVAAIPPLPQEQGEMISCGRGCSKSGIYYGCASGGSNDSHSTSALSRDAQLYRTLRFGSPSTTTSSCRRC